MVAPLAYAAIPVIAGGGLFLWKKLFPTHPDIPRGTPGVPVVTPGAPQIVTPVIPAVPGTPPLVVKPPEAPRVAPITPPNAAPVVVLPAVVQAGPQQAFAPGPMPKLPSPSGGGSSDEHKLAQQALIMWLTNSHVDDTAFLPVLKGIHYSAKDADGSIGPRTQGVTWLFQKYVNQFLHPTSPLTADGLFGPATYSVLKSYGLPADISSAGANGISLKTKDVPKKVLVEGKDVLKSS